MARATVATSGGVIGRVAGIVRDAWVTGLAGRALAAAYRRGVRPWLPSAGPARYGGVPVAYDRKWGDRRVPARWVPDEAKDVPEYEATLIAGLKELVRPGDRVVVVGGGVGATAITAALQAGPAGSVRCFEGARESVEKVRRTAEINGVSDWLVVVHAVVARPVSVYGTAPDEPAVAPSELPECDVLELDCEGAELDILRDMTVRPRVVLVETHGLYGATTPALTGLLEERGYRVRRRGVAEPRLRRLCEEHDIQVLAGVREESGNSG
jgi:hypothetical protein